MNAESFREFLDNPSRIYQITYQELKSLVLQYPYCQNLRYLLLKKSKIDNHRDFERNLRLAATFSLDRGYLFDQMQKLIGKGPEEENYKLEEDFLELRELSELETPETQEASQAESPLPGEQGVSFEPLPSESKQEDLTPPRQEPPEPEENRQAPAAETSADEEGASKFEEELEALFELVESELSNTGSIRAPDQDTGAEKDTNQSSLWEQFSEVYPDERLIREPTFQEPARMAAAIAEVVAGLRFQEPPSSPPEDFPVPESLPETTEEHQEPLVTAPLRPEPEPKSTFTSWLKQFEPPRLSVQYEALKNSDYDAGSSKEERKKRKEQVKHLAKKSVVESEEIASETLAAVLEQQGNYKKAIKMYERLQLLIPEKSSFFAVKIEELRKQL